MKNLNLSKGILCLYLLFAVFTAAAQESIVPPPINSGESPNNMSKPLVLLAPLRVENSKPKPQPVEIVNETVWDGATWSNGLPDAYTRIVINADYSTSEILSGYEIIIKDGVTLTIMNGGMLKLSTALVDAKKARITFREGSSLLYQLPNPDNRLDPLISFVRFNGYVCQYSSMYMSSPVTAQPIGSTFTTIASPDVSIAYAQYKYNGGYTLVPESEVMIPGQGYIETTNGNGSYDTELRLINYDHKYTVGSENTNSSYSINVGAGFNLLGNPYSSFLDADSFLQDPSNTTVANIYLWTRNTLAALPVVGASTFNFSSVDYAFYNLLGGVSAGKNVALKTNNVLIPANGRINYDTPDGKINWGTGFFVRCTGSGTATFRDNMLTTGTQTYRSRDVNNTTLTPPPTRNRIWLNLSNEIGDYRQTLVGYANGATAAGNDRLFDAPTFTDGSYNPLIDIYSLATGSTTKLAIQGHGLPFTNSDFFQLGYKVRDAGDYTFTSTADGIFPTQAYYILDANDTTPIRHTLPYSFYTISGVNNTRFKVVFENLTSIVSFPATCGTILANSFTTIYSNQVAGATAYMFEVTEGNPPGIGTFIGEFSGNAGSIFQFNLNFAPIIPNTTYFIRVATYQVNNAWAYGPVCMVTTPPPPTSSIISPLCGSTITNSWASIIGAQVNNVYGINATSYRFNVSATIAGTPYAIQSNAGTANSCTLHSFPGLPIVANTAYTITVEVFWSGFWRLGPPCIINTGSPVTRLAYANNTTFEAKAYPNPFTHNFNLNLNTSSEDKVEIKVYDMIGRMIESREVAASEMAAQSVGEQYLSGVYTIVIKQGAQSESLRVIKR